MGDNSKFQQGSQENHTLEFAQRLALSDVEEAENGDEYSIGIEFIQINENEIPSFVENLVSARENAMNIIFNSLVPAERIYHSYLVPQIDNIIEYCYLRQGRLVHVEVFAENIEGLNSGLRTIGENLSVYEMLEYIDVSSIYQSAFWLTNPEEYSTNGEDYLEGIDNLNYSSSEYIHRSFLIYIP
ncbi:hypothetical protein COV24_04985 [candidate division WWE3 bacterium CG10_big_fil_rev_8_21_14_0_10_32_10]|uniref:Uncharacterized protein n=1 Tax=candidate division WWE3 bacterium CG10_big_fil_rev_8_21_14_0_10_32_10 TaxID=1975090 RepID=A0A2H0R8X3_UNCKA|nr:MAG: hypothetical protein COV24_04985 [candidate division WWE3 bacterium CG10_big_fil_rev_8_21_14_0_10_32_10]